MVAVKDRKQQSGTFASVFNTRGKYPNDLQTIRQPLDSFQILQRSLGNHYLNSLSLPAGQPDGLLIQRTCACGGSCANCMQRKDERRMLQPKLVVGAPNDKYEREADRVAEQVMSMPEPQVQLLGEGLEEEEEEEPIQTKPRVDRITPLVQRQEELEEEEEYLYPKLVDEVQRKCEDSEEENSAAVQSKPSGGRTPQVASSLAVQINSLRESGGQPLSEETRAFFEPRFGHDFSHVRVHTDVQAAESSRALNAQAYTVGHDVVFGAGQYAPETTDGRRLLAHELTHILQQSGRVSQLIQRAPCPTTACSGYRNTHCSAYRRNAWWLPPAYVNNATLACRETPNHPTAMCVRKTLQDLLAATPAGVKHWAASMRRYAWISPVGYNAFVISRLTPRFYNDHVTAYRTAGCPSGPAAYPAWIAVSTIPMPRGTVGWSIRYGGGSCSGTRGRWC